MSATTRMASILVTDLAGSTELRVRLGEDRAEELRRVHDALLVDAVTRNGGTVVKGLGDGVLATFAGAADAIAAAVAIQQAADAHTRRHPGEPLVVRAGLSAGDVTEEDGDCFGTPVIEASRLCGVAEPGRILASDLVRAMARGRGGHRFHVVGELDLKGLPEAVETVEVGWEPDSGGAVPLPAALVGLAVPLAGRASELQRVKEAWSEAVDGHRQVVFLAGEPGIGKTRLASEIAHLAAAEGAVVLHGGCDEALDVAYRPVVDALVHLIDHIDVDVLEAHGDAVGGELTRLVPGLAAKVPGLAPAGSEEGDVGRLRLFEAVVDLLGRVAEERPVLLVLDDLHWADRSSLLLLRHLVRSPRLGSLLVLGTYRDTDLDRVHPLSAALGELRREPGVQRVALQGLEVEDIERFLAGAAGHEVGEDGVAVAEVLRAETAGNPLFVSEVVRHLVERGVFYEEDGLWRTDRALLERVGVPEGVREVIGHRLSALAPDAGDLMSAAAVVGVEFDAGVVAEVTGRTVDDVVDVLDEGVRRGLLVETDRLDRYRFAHALVRQTLVDELSLSRRVRLHGRVAVALEQRRAPAAELAHHFAGAAALGYAEQAVTYSARAAEEAVAALAYEEAAAWLRQALEAEELLEPPDPGRRGRLYLELGLAENLIGDVTVAFATFEAAAAEARAAGDTELLARTALGFGGENAVWAGLGDLRGPALVDEALEALPPGDSAPRARLLARKGQWLILAPEPAERVALGEEAVAMARRLGDRQELAAVLVDYHEALRGANRVEEQRAVSQELVAMAEAAGDEAALATALYFRGSNELAMADVNALRRTLDEMGERAVRARALSAWGGVVGGRSVLAIAEGRWDDLPDLLAEYRRSDFGLGSVNDAVADLRHANIALLQGRYADMADEWQGVADRHPDVMTWFPYRTISLGLIGDADGAHRALAEWESGPVARMPATFRLNNAVLDSLVAGVLGDELFARRARAVLETVPGRYVSTGVESFLGAVDHHLGVALRVLGEVDEAERLLRAAVGGYDRNGIRSFRVHAALELAELGVPDAARFAAEARAGAEEMAMSGLRSRLAALP